MIEKSFTLLKPRSKNLNKKMKSSSVSAANPLLAQPVCSMHLPPLHKKIPGCRNDDEELGWRVFRCVGIFTRAENNQNNGV